MQRTKEEKEGYSKTAVQREREKECKRGKNKKRQ